MVKATVDVMSSFVLLIIKSTLLFTTTTTTSTAQTLCYNSPSFRIDNDPDKPCSWLRYGSKKNENRREAHCTSFEVYQACPQSCGSCCEDDPTYEFKILSKEMKDCEWLSKTEFRQQKWCGDSDDQFKTYQNGRMIRAACPVTCDFCFDDASIGPTTFKLASSSSLSLPSPLDISTFNPIDIPFCFDTYDDVSVVDASTFLDLKLVVVNEVDPYYTEELITSNFTFVNTVESAGFCSADLMTFPGLLNVTVEGIHASSGRSYKFSTSLWAGNEVAVLSLFQEDGSVFTADVTITAQSSDDVDVTSTVHSTGGSGIVSVENLPVRTIIYVAVSKDGDYGLTATVGGEERTMTLVGFNEPSEIDNNDFSKGLDGWVTPGNASIYVKVVDHVEDVVVGNSTTTTRSLRRRENAASGSSKIVRNRRPTHTTSGTRGNTETPSRAGSGERSKLNNQLHHRQLYISTNAVDEESEFMPSTSGGSNKNIFTSSAVVAHSTDLEGNKDVELSTNGTYDDKQTLSRTFNTNPGVNGLTIRYKFITEEVPNGYYGSQWNDYFAVTTRVISSGQVISKTKSMNMFKLDEFDYATGSLLNWIEETVDLDLDKNGDAISVDISVGNRGDNLYDSTIIVDYIEEVSSYLPFSTNLELKDEVAKYCADPEAWKDHPDFQIYG